MTVFWETYNASFYDKQKSFRTEDRAIAEQFAIRRSWDSMNVEIVDNGGVTFYKNGRKL